MADLGFAVNVDELPEAKDFAPVEAGDYTGMIINTKLKPTNDTKKAMKAAGFEDYDKFRKANNPKASGYLELEIDILDEGKFKGRKVFCNLNLINDNAQAVEIAAGQMRQLMESIGVKSLPDGKTEALHNKRFKMRLEIKAGNEYVSDGVKKQGQPQNAVKKFMPVGAVTAADTTQAVVGGTTKTSPWSR